MDFKLIAFSYLIGLGVLVAALAINLASSYLGITTWYEFIINLKNGFVPALGDKKILSAFFLFILYPLALGLISYFIIKKISI